MQLTKTQKLAVEARGKNILVSAGAGTGKTRVLVERYLHAVASGEALVGEILALTFTEKAANEMKKRILDRFRELGLEGPRRELESAYISTLHAFAVRLLREHPIEAGVDPDFRVVESEEADFLKEAALEETLENHCEPGSDAFELLRVYGEYRIAEGLIAVFHAARHEGKSLKVFFEQSIDEKTKGVRPMGLTPSAFEAVDEPELAKEWNRFQKLKTWNWKTIEDFKAWKSTFSRKRGKKGSTEWPEIKAACKVFLSQKIEVFAKPWREKFESLALLFEACYEAKKREKGILDFDDLQIKALSLFKEDKNSSSNVARKHLRERYQKKFRQILVDEFQDTNALQLEWVELLANRDNLFLVGDYKQSIYAFRGAEPRLFLEKENGYREGDAGVRISLAENFRSSETVIDFVNDFFRKLWQEDSFPYEDLMARIEKCESDCVELISVAQEKGEPLSEARKREAEQIAEKILELQEQGVSPGNMAILFQAMTDTAIYEQALKNKNIPYYVISGRGFYHQPEIRDMTSFLMFLENPLSDIPLAATLRSPLFQVSDDALFWLAYKAKGKKKKAPLYEGVKQWESIEEISEVDQEKLRSFHKIAKELLAVKDRLRLTELLDVILEKTSYELTVLSHAQGVRRYANLKKMISLAREFEAFEPMSLGVFLKTLKRLEVEEARESEAQIEAEESGRVVRLLSIHRAKGLEFPVVFVADMGRGRQGPESKAVIADPVLGYGLTVRNEQTAEEEKPWSWEQIYEALNQKDKEEWKRLLYVAMTRAQNRLILSGVYKEKKNSENVSSWMDWALKYSGLESLETKKTSVKGSVYKKTLQKSFEVFESKSLEELVPDKNERIEAEAFREKILARIETPPKQPSRVIDLPVSAYALYQKDPAAYRSAYEIGYPDFLTEERDWRFYQDEEHDMSAADFGTQVHRLLELMNFKEPTEAPSPEMLRVLKSLNEKRQEEAKEILQAFSQSPFCQRLATAQRIHREVPFILDERHGKIHGVIDLLFQDGSGLWHVADYKTAIGDADKVKESAYDLQILIYAYAVQKILGVTPKSGVVYFLKNQWCETLPLDDAAMEVFGQRLKALQKEILESYRGRLGAFAK